MYQHYILMIHLMRTRKLTCIVLMHNYCGKKVSLVIYSQGFHVIYLSCELLFTRKTHFVFTVSTVVINSLEVWLFLTHRPYKSEFYDFKTLKNT